MSFHAVVGCHSTLPFCRWLPFYTVVGCHSLGIHIHTNLAAIVVVFSQNDSVDPGLVHPVLELATADHLAS